MSGGLGRDRRRAEDDGVPRGAVAERDARAAPLIPEATLTKAPSAELRPNQTDQDSLPPYDVLDDILQRHIEQPRAGRRDHRRRLRRRRPCAACCGWCGAAEFKRKQAAPGLKVTDRAFGTGWRMPIAARLDAD